MRYFLLLPNRVLHQLTIPVTIGEEIKFTGKLNVASDVKELGGITFIILCLSTLMFY